jgi:hypothetical protein
VIFDQFGVVLDDVYDGCHVYEKRTPLSPFRDTNQILDHGTYLDPTGPYLIKEKQPGAKPPFGIFVNPNTQQPRDVAERQKLIDWQNDELFEASKETLSVILTIRIAGFQLVPIVQTMQWIPDGGAASGTRGTVVIQDW